MAEIEAFLKQAKAAKQASSVLSCASTLDKNRALTGIAEAIQAQTPMLLQANQQDLASGRNKGLADALLDRLALNTERLAAICAGLKQIAELPDPVGTLTDMQYRPSGIQVGKMRVPLGVVGIIYESRPNVTVDAAALCLKSGNACLLRGGSEAFHSNQAFAQCIQNGLLESGLPAEAVQVLQSTDRAWVSALLTATDWVDVIIPRGGKGLIERVTNESKIPVIKHLDGVCHVYIDREADAAKALAIAVNAKTRRYGVCNAIETLLIDQTQRGLLSALVQAYTQHGVELRLCERSQAAIEQSEDIPLEDINWQPATEDDWSSEYLAPILSVKVVDGITAAIAHINHYGSQHTDAIVTESWINAREFTRRVDSSSVMVNASTAFADGFEYGLGAEIGISTDRLHVRGPVGLEGLTNQKYIVLGDGHIRQ